MGRTELVPLSFANLEDLDNGKQAMAFRKHMQRLSQDCMDRPGDSSARTLNIKVTLTPIIGEDGMCESVKLELEHKSTVPPQISRPFEMQVTKAGVLFNKDFPEALDQIPLGFDPKPNGAA